MKDKIQTIYLQANNVYIELHSKSEKDIADMSSKDRERLIKNLSDIEKASLSLIKLLEVENGEKNE